MILEVAAAAEVVTTETETEAEVIVETIEILAVDDTREMTVAAAEVVDEIVILDLNGKNTSVGTF